jgi:quercetin dioxygenase-like cupin family protein
MSTVLSPRVEDRVVSAVDVPEDEFMAVSICGYEGYRLRWLSPPDAQLLWNLAACPPGHLKLCHRHPNADSLLIFLDGECEFLLGGGETRPARPGDVLFSVDGLLHGVRNTGDSWARWVYVEGPMPLVTEFPTSEIIARSPSGELASIVRRASSHMRASLAVERPRTVLGGGDMSAFGTASLPAADREALLNPLLDRVMSLHAVEDRVGVRDGFSTRFHSPDFGNTRIWLETPSLDSEVPLHRVAGADTVVVFLAGEADYLWSAGETGDVHTARLLPGSVAWAVDGEFHGLRNVGPGPARYASISGPQPIEGAATLWGR